MGGVASGIPAGKLRLQTLRRAPTAIIVSLFSFAPNFSIAYTTCVCLFGSIHMRCKLVCSAQTQISISNATVKKEKQGQAGQGWPLADPR